MNRREILKLSATGVAGLGAGYALVEQTTEQAQAAVSMQSLNISDASTTTDDGTIQDVRADVSGDWSYDLPAGKSPDQWQVSLSVTDGENVNTVAETQGNAKYLSAYRRAPNAQLSALHGS